MQTLNEKLLLVDHLLEDRLKQGFSSNNFGDDKDHSMVSRNLLTQPDE